MKMSMMKKSGSLFLLGDDPDCRDPHLADIIPIRTSRGRAVWSSAESHCSDWTHDQFIRQERFVYGDEWGTILIQGGIFGNDVPTRYNFAS